MAKNKRPKNVSNSKAIGFVLGKAGDQGVPETYAVYQRAEVPGGDTSSDGTQKDAFAKARLIARTNYWLKGFLSIKRSVMNYGMQLKVVSKTPGKEVTEKDIQRLDKWLMSPAPVPEVKVDANDKTIGIPNVTPRTMRSVLYKFIEDVWSEFILLDNVVAFWMDESPIPITLAPEKCRYKDVLGMETLFYTHGLGVAEKKLLNPKQQERFKLSEIAIDSNQGEFFRVLKDERTGAGFAWPSVQPIFITDSTIKSMEIGESTYAFTGRMHFRHHKIGHAIESGPMAGMPKHFWSVKKATSILGVFENKSGFLGDFTSNFDYTVEYPHEDIDYFDEKKWLSPEHRLIKWGGALAQMIQITGVTPFTLNLLKAEVFAMREKMGVFLQEVINESFSCPVLLEIKWSESIFNDARLFSELLKFGVGAGAISHSTFREEIGIDDERETVKKDTEGKDSLTNARKYMPPFDPAHGVDPNAPQGGSPPGAPHNDNTQAGG